MSKPQAPAEPPRPAKKDEPGSASIHDVTWDDDTAPHLDFDERAFDRVTAIPEMPPELFAKQVMEAAAAAETAIPQPATEPPPVSVPRAPSIPFELATSERASPIDVGPPSAPPHSVRQARALAARGAEAGGRDLLSDPGALSSKPAPSPRGMALDLDLNGLEVSLDKGFARDEDPALRELADRHAMGDFSGALVLAEGVLETQPDHPEALRYAKNCRDVLTSMYTARLGPLNQLVRVVIPTEQIRWLSLDHRAGFLLSLVDGISTLEEILDISGMPRLDALRIMYSLREERVITLSPK
ncbi:MAG TPA: hypothetical protein VFQ61_33030 [Polyangiaceae bacterium]|nr:hypothetical protein [Polyangiaceae bacterium]